MKKEEQISVLLAALFAYSLYRWGRSLYFIFSDGYSGFSFYTFSYFLILLAGVAGLVQFYSSGYTKSPLLRLYLIYDFVSSVFSYFPSTVRVFVTERSAWTLVYMVVETVGLVVAFYALSVLARHRTPKVQESRQEDGSVALHYVPVPKGTRFLNRLLDTLLLILVMYNSYPNWDFLIESYFGYLPYVVTQVMLPILLGYILTVVYYLLMEYFFHTSFSKVFTQTTVINALGGYPSFSTTWVRSLCRIIPFDSLSFLFGDKGGWHDTISKTGVVEDKYVD